MRKLRAVAMLVCVALVGLSIAALVADKEEEPFGPREGWIPGFSTEYQCSDPRDEFRSSELAYDLRYEDDRWVAHTTLSVARDGLRGVCNVDFGVPRGSVDVERGSVPDDVRVVTLARHGSSSSGTATVVIRPAGRGVETEEVSFDVVLPRHYDVAHSLGLGMYFFKFDFFGPGEAGSFRSGRVTINLPAGHSFLDALPPPAGAGDDPIESRTWPLKAGRDLEVLVTYQNDTLRRAVELAPQILIAALVALFALTMVGSREPAAAEDEPEPAAAEPDVSEPDVSEPVAAEPVAPEPVAPEPVAPAPEPVVPEPVAPEPEPEPEPEPVAPEPEPVATAPEPVAPAPKLQPPPPPPFLPPPAVRPEPPPRRRYAWLALLAVPVLGRLLRRRSRR